MDERAANLVQRTQNQFGAYLIILQKAGTRQRARDKNISSKLKKQERFLPTLYRYQTFMFRQSKD